MKEKPWVRGAVWIGVGAVVWMGSFVWGRPVVVRGTELPWGLVVIGVGGALLAWDLRKAKKKPE
jgi:hypothetical protein